MFSYTSTIDAINEMAKKKIIILMKAWGIKTFNIPEGEKLHIICSPIDEYNVCDVVIREVQITTDENLAFISELGTKWYFDEVLYGIDFDRLIHLLNEE